MTKTVVTQRTSSTATITDELARQSGEQPNLSRVWKKPISEMTADEKTYYEEGVIAEQAILQKNLTPEQQEARRSQRESAIEQHKATVARHPSKKNGEEKKKTRCVRKKPKGLSDKDKKENNTKVLAVLQGVLALEVERFVAEMKKARVLLSMPMIYELDEQLFGEVFNWLPDEQEQNERITSSAGSWSLVRRTDDDGDAILALKFDKAEIAETAIPAEKIDLTNLNARFLAMLLFINREVDPGLGKAKFYGHIDKYGDKCSALIMGAFQDEYLKQLQSLSVEQLKAKQQETGNTDEEYLIEKALSGSQFKGVVPKEIAAYEAIKSQGLTYSPQTALSDLLLDLVKQASSDYIDNSKQRGAQSFFYRLFHGDKGRVNSEAFVRSCSIHQLAGDATEKSERSLSDVDWVLNEGEGNTRTDSNRTFLLHALVNTLFKEESNLTRKQVAKHFNLYRQLVISKINGMLKPEQQQEQQQQQQQQGEQQQKCNASKAGGDDIGVLDEVDLTSPPTSPRR